MDFLSKLLHRNPSGGGGSPQKPLSSKASDTIGQIKSETNLTNKSQPDVILSPNHPQASQLPEHDCHKKTSVFKSKNLHHDEEEDEIFEDAQENKLSVTILAADLDNIHISTPKSMSTSRVEHHEFVDTKEYRSELSNSSYLSKSYVDSEISFGHNTSLGRSLSPDVIGTESKNETINIGEDCNISLNFSRDSSDNVNLSVAISKEASPTLNDRIFFDSPIPNQNTESQINMSHKDVNITNTLTNGELSDSLQSNLEKNVKMSKNTIEIDLDDPSPHNSSVVDITTESQLNCDKENREIIQNTEDSGPDLKQSELEDNLSIEGSSGTEIIHQISTSEITDGSVNSSDIKENLKVDFSQSIAVDENVIMPCEGTVEISDNSIVVSNENNVECLIENYDTKNIQLCTTPQVNLKSSAPLIVPDVSIKMTSIDVNTQEIDEKYDLTAEAKTVSKIEDEGFKECRESFNSKGSISEAVKIIPETYPMKKEKCPETEDEEYVTKNISCVLSGYQIGNKKYDSMTQNSESVHLNQTATQVVSTESVPVQTDNKSELFSLPVLDSTLQSVCDRENKKTIQNVEDFESIEEGSRSLLMVNSELGETHNIKTIINEMKKVDVSNDSSYKVPAEYVKIKTSQTQNKNESMEITFLCDSDNQNKFDTEVLSSPVVINEASDNCSKENSDDLCKNTTVEQDGSLALENASTLSENSFQGPTECSKETISFGETKLPDNNVVLETISPEGKGIPPTTEIVPLVIGCESELLESKLGIENYQSVDTIEENTLSLSVLGRGNESINNDALLPSEDALESCEVIHLNTSACVDHNMPNTIDETVRNPIQVIDNVLPAFDLVKPQVNSLNIPIENQVTVTLDEEVDINNSLLSKNIQKNFDNNEVATTHIEVTNEQSLLKPIHVGSTSFGSVDLSNTSFNNEGVHCSITESLHTTCNQTTKSIDSTEFLNSESVSNVPDRIMKYNDVTLPTHPDNLVDTAEKASEYCELTKAFVAEHLLKTLDQSVESNDLPESSNDILDVTSDLQVNISDSTDLSKAEILHDTSGQVNQPSDLTEKSNAEQLFVILDQTMLLNYLPEPSNDECPYNLSERVMETCDLNSVVTQLSDISDQITNINDSTKVSSSEDVSNSFDHTLNPKDLSKPKNCGQVYDIQATSDETQLSNPKESFITDHLTKSLNSDQSLNIAEQKVNISGLIKLTYNKQLPERSEKTMNADDITKPLNLEFFHNLSDQKMESNCSDPSNANVVHNASVQAIKSLELTQSSRAEDLDSMCDYTLKPQDLSRSSNSEQLSVAELPINDETKSLNSEQVPDIVEQAVNGVDEIKSLNPDQLHNITEKTVIVGDFTKPTNEQQFLNTSMITINTDDLTESLNVECLHNVSDQTIKSDKVTKSSNVEVLHEKSDKVMKSEEVTELSIAVNLCRTVDLLIESKDLSKQSHYEQLHDIVEQPYNNDLVLEQSNYEQLYEIDQQTVNTDVIKPSNGEQSRTAPVQTMKSNHVPEPSLNVGCLNDTSDHALKSEDLSKPTVTEQLNDVSDQIKTFDQFDKSSDVTEAPNAVNLHNLSDLSNKTDILTKPLKSESESVNDKHEQISDLKNVSPKTTKCTKSKILPKRSLNKSFQIAHSKSKSNLVENTMCEFFITSEKKTDDDFDERLTEEAANLSDHFLNLSQQMEYSDSEKECNKTVIALNNEQSKPRSSYALPSFPEKSSMFDLSHCKELQRSLEMTNNYSSHEAYMQSMHSVLPAHLNQSEAGPITADELSTQDLEFQDGASLDLDYFNQVGNKEEKLRSSSLIRDSLYVKFDPIVNAIVSKTVGDTFKMPLPEQERTSEDQNELRPKAEEPEDTEKTPGKTAVSEAVKKLISLTPSPSGASVSTTKSERSSLGTPTSVPPKSAYISPEQLKKELTKLENIMREREKYFEVELEKKDNELKARSAKQAEMEAELKVVAEREHRLKKEVVERTKSKQQLGLVMEEYEKTISQLVAQKEEDKKEFEVQKDMLMKERDTAMQHLNNMEIAFNDVHQKYERSKTVIEGMKANEDSLKKSLSEYDEAIKTSNDKYESLKNHAIKQLETANQELDLIRRSHQAEVAKLKAMLKKAEVRVTSLEESLEQKSKENQELAAICDELISKVGSTGN